MPGGGMSTIRPNQSVLTRAFRANFSLSSPRKRLQDRYAVFRFNNACLFREKYTVKSSFCPKSVRKY